MTKKSQRRKASKTENGYAGKSFGQTATSETQNAIKDHFRQLHNDALPAILEEREREPRLGVDNEDILRAFGRYLVSSFDYMDACVRNDIFSSLMAVELVDGTSEGMAVIDYSAARPGSDEYQRGDVWKIRIPLPQFASEAEFEGTLKAHIAQLSTMRKTLKLLEESLSGVPGNAPVLACFLSEHGYIQDVNGYLLSGSAITARPGVYDGVVRYPGPVSKYTLKKLVERWSTEHVARQKQEKKVLERTLQGLYKTFEFDSVEPTKETVWNGTTMTDGKRIPVTMRFEESGLGAVLTRHVTLASLVGDRLTEVPAKVGVGCDWIHIPSELLDAVKKKCPDIAERIPHFIKLPDGRVAEISMKRRAA